MRNNDRVLIKLGPARYDSDKAVRDKITDAIDEAANDAYNAIVNNPNLNLAGTGTPSGQVTPLDQPIGYLNPDFPITTYDPLNTGQLPMEIFGFGDRVLQSVSLGLSGHPFSLGYDVSGAFGAGSDLIYGRDESSAGSVNGFSRSTATNVSLFPTATSGVTTGDGLVQFMQPNGRAVTWSVLGYGMSYRYPGDPGWTSESGVTGTTTNTFWAGDPVTGAVWGFKVVNGSPLDTIAVYRFLPTDATIQSVGDMGIIPTTNGVIHVTPTGGNGFITLMFQDNSTSNYRYYVKASGDTSNFTNCGTFSAGSFSPGFATGPAYKMAVSALGETSYVYRDTVTGTLHIRLIDQNAIVYDHDTGIPTPVGKMQMHTHLSSGLVAVVATLLTTDLGDVNPDRLTAALATYNYSTTSYQYYDIGNYVTTLVGGQIAMVGMGGLQEVLPGEVRYSWGTNLGTTSTDIEYVEVVGVSGL